MSDVKLICVYNQFDYNGTLYESNEGTDLKEIYSVFQNLQEIFFRY